jgi:hypothetical protein
MFHPPNEAEHNRLRFYEKPAPNTPLHFKIDARLSKKYVAALIQDNYNVHFINEWTRFPPSRELDKRLAMQSTTRQEPRRFARNSRFLEKIAAERQNLVEFWENGCWAAS